VVIFIFSSNTAPAEIYLPPWLGVTCLLGLPLAFYWIAGKVYARIQSESSNQYFQAEKKLSMLALLFFVVSVYFLQIKYYLQPMSFNERFPIFVNFAGLCYYFVFLFIMWSKARETYQNIFGRSYSTKAFVLSNLKINLPIVLPWLLISLVFDVLNVFSIPGLNRFMESPWGDFLIFAVFVVFLAVFFPPLIRRLWNCTPLPQGVLRSRLEFFCRKNNFYSPILLWPLFEGQVITAAIMGFMPKFRYLLVTPALLSTMTDEEVDSVLAHEIGHVRKKHLLLYLLLFFGFSLLIGALFKPLPYVIYSSEVFYVLQRYLNVSVESFGAFIVVSLMLVLMIVYFRFIFGYFIRNFERQADLHVFDSIGSATGLISAFEKIARLSGNIRSQKSWHHFGIGERVDFLELCTYDRKKINKHNQKVYLSLALYFVILFTVVGLTRQLNVETMADNVVFHKMYALLQDKLKKEPEKSQVLLAIAQLMLKQELEERAIRVYEKSVQLEPLNADTKNNLAWLLLTAKNKSLRDQRRALTLARSAIALKQEGYIYDTLATAYWANGFQEEAIMAEAKAIQIDPVNRQFYRQQVEKFSEQKWTQEE
jgi:Zn-dependent protease with chaperone function